MSRHVNEQTNVKSNLSNYLIDIVNIAIKKMYISNNNYFKGGKIKRDFVTFAKFS